VLNIEDFGVHFSSIFCGFFFIVFVHFLYFLLPPIVKVDISDIAIISVIPDMVKTITSGITNTPQKTYRIAQYTDSWNWLHSLFSGKEDAWLVCKGSDPWYFWTLESRFSQWASGRCVCLLL